MTTSTEHPTDTESVDHEAPPRSKPMLVVKIVGGALALLAAFWVASLVTYALLS